MDESFLEENRTCPYCNKVIDTRPYWNHIANEHPEEYENSRNTWYPLYKDYSLAGMEITQILMVMPELFNTSAEEIESFLIDQSFKEKIKNGTERENAISEIAETFHKDEDFIKKIIG